MTPLRVDPHDFFGFAAPFDIPTTKRADVQLAFKPGAFRKAIAENVVELWPSHAYPPSVVLASSANGTLQLEERAAGLYVYVWMPDATVREQLTERIRTGDVIGLSLDFATKIIHGVVDEGTGSFQPFDSAEITHHKFGYEADPETTVGIVRVYHQANGLRAIALSTPSDKPGFQQTWLRRVYR